PDNVIGRRDDPGPLVVKILDFGLAKFPGSETTSGTVTADGIVLGTLGYMSPEQRRGQPIDHRTDLYAVGVILIEALTGRRPADGEEPRPLPGAVGELVRRCVARDPRDRY